MSLPAYRILANAFIAEGVDTVFVLTGDGNMYWEAAFAEAEGTQSIHVRHEHCAVAMASAHARITNSIGVASVTCGPGLSQTMTALATAVHARIPIVVFAGESPMHKGWFNQAVDQAPFVTATGARYISIHSLKRLTESVAEAFHYARSARQPVVIGVPFDLQQEKIDPVPVYRPSRGFLPDAGPRAPHPAYLARAAERVERAKKIIILGGLGARDSGAAAACIALAQRCNAALATTLPARGLFAGHPSDIGVAGGFAHPVTIEAFKTADLVIAVGAGLNAYTTNSDKLFGPDKVLWINDAPAGFVQGRCVADLVLAADAKLGVEMLTETLSDGDWPDWGAADYARRLRREPVDTTPYEIPEGTTDPREVVTVLDHLLPKDWAIVNSSGHCSFFSVHMFDRPADNFLTIREFGPIGNGLPYACAMAVARPDRPSVLIEGDGGLMMHVQELETIRREGWKILLCILNDGAYGSEIHKLRVDGLSDAGATYGRNDIARIAEGFGLRGRMITDTSQLAQAVAEFEAGEGAMLLDIQISDKVISPRMLNNIKR